MQGMIARLATEYGNLFADHARVPIHFHAAAKSAKAGGFFLRD
jgi:hypothetical protein